MGLTLYGTQINTIADADEFVKRFNASNLTKDGTNSIIQAYSSLLPLYAVGTDEYNYLQNQINSWTKGRNLYYGAPSTERAYDTWYEKAVNGAQYAYDSVVDIYRDRKNSAYSLAADARAEAERLAEKSRTQGVQNAYLTYDKSKSTYGRNAEALAQNGLTNSGYSDYLTGVAYGNMIGGVQNAHQTADNALLEAAYAEKEAQATADTAYYTSLANADANYQKNLAAIESTYAQKEGNYSTMFNTALSAAQKGELQNFTAEQIGAAYGLSEADALSVYYNTNANIVKATNEINEADKAKFEAALGGAYNSETGVKEFYSDEQIRAMAKELGITDETQIASYIETSHKNQDEVNKEYYLSLIDYATTDAEIDAYTSFYDQSIKEDLKSERDKKKTDYLIESIRESSDAATDSIENVENHREKMSLEKYQECYFYNALNLIDKIGENGLTKEEIEGCLNRWRGEQLDEQNYSTLSAYLDKVANMNASAEKVKSKAGFWNIVKASVAGVLTKDLLWNNRRNVTIDGTKYTVDVVDKYTPTDEEINVFNSIAGNNNVIRIGDEYYVKHSRTGEWAKVKKEGTDEEFFDIVNSKARTPKIVNKPTYQNTKG